MIPLLEISWKYGYDISYIWSNYSDLTRPHPKWWFRKGHPLISGKSRLVKYYNLARYIRFLYVHICDIMGGMVCHTYHGGIQPSSFSSMSCVPEAISKLHPLSLRQSPLQQSPGNLGGNVGSPRKSAVAPGLVE